MTLVLTNPLTVKYNGTDLNSIPGLTVLQRNINGLPSRNLRIHKLARTDGSIITTSEYATRVITFGGAIIQDDRATAEATIDKLRALVYSPEGDIDVQVAGSTRRFVGTMSGMSTVLKGGYVDFTLEFTCSYPFGTDPNTVTLANAVSNTGSSTTLPVAIEGSYKAEPDIIITYSAISGGTASTVSVFNAADGIGLDITRNWVTGDILEIDNTNKSVQVNSLDVARVGRFFSFDPGPRAIGYNDTFATSRTMTLTATYNKRYV